ncbi:PREDICTED: protein PFC0760c-like [Cyphomyrmex costatus]|uniref:protein PFC0760c-like n=1 Tax=Cyphomyrmex costatus TaxID=456900 RepID=UPI000852449B|nr:PREDICTED: protein PFC0760c-like [Cyphomyrmex costatus]
MKSYREYVCLLLRVIPFVTNCLAENLILNINVKKLIAVTDHAFLSFTLDPATLQYNDFIKNIEKSTNLARGLAPAYIRLGGPQSNFYNFEQVHSHEVNTDPNNMHFGTQWTFIYQWAKNAGLDVIACISPHYIDKELKTDSTDPRNIAELLSFSDRMGYNISWQLGYECQTRCNLSGGDLGQYVANLHEILKTFPRYSNSLITGPDILAYRTAYQQKYLQDYLHSANAALSAITWHPNLDSVPLSDNNISIYYDNLIAEKDELYKIINHVGKKPLWIVGREVLELKLQSNSESYVHFYSQCTKPSALYGKGAVTIFGINLTPKTVTTSLKGLKIKILHKYILLPEFEIANKMISEKVLLNNEPLNLKNDKNLPDIYPEIIINPDGLELELPSGGIGFWIIPNAKVKACTCSEEEIIGDNTVKKLSKRHENNIQQLNQEKEEDINQSNLKNEKVYDKQDNETQQNVENISNKNQQKAWSSKLLDKMTNFLQKRLQKINKNDSSQKSVVFNLEEKKKSSEEIEEQQNLDSKKLKKTEIDDKFKNIQHLLNKYKRILLEKKTMMDTKNIQLFQLEIKNIDNVMMLISKIDAFILYNITLKESDTSEIKHKTQNKEELIIKINKKLKEYLSELENSVEIKTNIIKKIEKNFNKLYNLLEYNDLTKDNKNSQVFNHKDLMEQKKFKRHLDKKSKNSQKNSILEKPQKNNLKDYVIKQKIQQKNDNNIDNVKKNFINSKNKYDNPLQRDPVKRFFKNDAFENANRHTNHQHLVQENNKIKNDNICRKYSKINDMEKYQNLIQERMKRDNTKKWVETDLKEDSASRKHSRIDDLTNYVNERKMKPKDGVRRELLLPFNPRIDSDENNFYGFFRQDPVKGFPEGDIFVTAGDSLEQTDDGYDYVKNEDNNNNNGLKKKNTQHSQKSTLDHAKDNTWIEEVKDDHCDYTPNEFFENIQSSNIKIQENSKNYDDLGEAEFLSEVHNNNNKNNNKIAITKIIRKQPLNEENEKHIKKTRIQRLVHYYDDLKKQEFNRDKLQSASRYPSTSFNHLLKIPNSNINYQESNVKFEGAKLKKKPESKISNFFYPPSEASTIRYNYNNNYQISNMNYDTLKEKNGFDKDIDSSDNAKITEYSRPNLYAEHSVYNNIFHNKRNKRSNSEELRKIFVQEIVKEDEENARDCHCRIIRASDSPKKLYYHRMKRNILVPTAKVTDTSLENTNESANVAQFLKGLTTEEEYQEIMTGDILPSTSDIEPDYEENDITTKSVITELRKLNHNLSNTAHEVNNAKKSTTNLLPVDLDSKLSINNNDSVKYITEETFFRTQDIQSENKTKTYDSPQIISKTFSENKNVREEIPISTTNNAQETIYKKIQELNKKEPDSSIYPTITEDNKNEEGNNNNYKISLKSINPLKETTKGIVEQVTMETILLKRAASTAIDNTKSNELLIKSKLLRNTHIEDNQNSESAWIPLGKDANMRRLKTKLQNLPQTSLGLTRYEKHLTKRAEQTDIKLKEKLYARREKLLHQYQNKLTKIANEQKRNLKRKEGDDNFRRLIDILDIHQVFAKLKSGKAQHQVSRLQEYIKKLPIKDYYDQERTNSTNNLDKQKQYDLSKKLPEFAQVWLISLNRRNVDQANNKEINKLNDIHKNFKADRDNLNSTFAINETIEFIKSFGIERKIENKEFDSSNDKKRNIMHSETTEDAEDVKTKKYENVEMTKHEKINESYNINDKVENNLNITMFNNNKTVEHVKNIEDNAKEEELGKKNSRLSTILPYPSLYNDELIKDKSKRSLILLMPVSQTQNKHEKSKEMVQKSKRCGTHKKNGFLSSTKENNTTANTADKNINVETFQKNSNNHTVKNTKNSPKNSATSKRMVVNTNEDRTLSPFKDNLNAKDMVINLKFPEKTKKCNTDKYICHCEEENCSSSSSKESSSETLGSSRDEPKRINHQERLTKHENAKTNILQQQSPNLYYENPYKLPFSNLINYFPIQPYSEKLNVPPVPVLYGITPNVLSHMIRNKGKYIDVGIPFIPFQGEPNNYLVRNNQYQPIIHKKPCICSPIITNSAESSMSVTNSPSTDYVDTTTNKEITKDLESNDPIDITEEDQEHSPELTTGVSNVDTSTDSEAETNLNLTDAAEEDNTVSPSNLNKIVQKSKDFTKQTERNLDDSSKLTTYSADNVDTNREPFVTYDITNGGKFINIDECIKLFGRDVCVLSAISPNILSKQAQENNPNKYTTIRIPEYATQISSREDINHSDKLEATDPYFGSESSTNKINKSNINEYLDSTSIKSNADIDEDSLREFHPESTKQISKSNINHDKNTPLNTVKKSHALMKKLMDPRATIDKTTTEKSKLLGKSKSHKTKLLLNPSDEETVNPTSSEKFLYSTPSYKSKSGKVNKSKVNQQNQITSTKSNSSTSQEETTTVINYDSKTDSKEQDKNYLKESNADIYSEKEIPQEHFEEETTTCSNFKTTDNFTEETEKEIIGIETSIKPEEISQEQFTTMHYFDDKKSNNLNKKENITNNIKTTDLSINKLPFCDNTLLLNSIRKVINDFTLDTRLAKTRDFDENILQTQGQNLLPEILQIPNLNDILLLPQIENTILEKVKNVLSYVTAIPREAFTNQWSHGVITNTLHSILDALSGFHHKLPPMTLAEHQFKDGQWKTNLVTLAPILDQKLSIAAPTNLRKIIKDLLSSPAIASQINQDIVRNIIVQSVKNNLTNDEDDKLDNLISHELNDILQMFKNSEDTYALGESSEVISDETDTDTTYMQEIVTSSYELGRKVDNSISNSKQNVDVKQKDTKINNKETRTNQKAKKILKNNANILTTSEFPQLLQLYEKKEKEESTNEGKIKEDIRNQILKKIGGQNDAEKKIAESLKPKIIYHKAILHNNLNLLEPNSTEAEQYIKNHPIDKESNKETTTITNFMQETPNYVSDNKILENIAGTKDMEEVNTLNKNTLTTTTDKIDPLIILERIKFNFPPIKYYSPEILKYATNRIDDKNVEITTASTNIVQKPSSNYAQDDTLLQNTTETKEENETEFGLTTTSGNLISSTNGEYKPTIISLTDNILEPQQHNFTENNIKIHEVTTEIQRTYAKTKYFKAGLSGDDSSRISQPSLAGETANIRINNDNEDSNGNSNNDNNNLINEMNNTEDVIKAKKVIVSSSKLSAVNDNYSSELFPSSIAPDNILELQRSQLYYINNGVRLPLEIKRLEDGSYALMISKNICEQILTRKCPCCVPLQGHIVRLLKNQQEDMHAMTTSMKKKDRENILGNNRYQFQPFNAVTRKSILKEQKLKNKEEKENRINEHYLWKQNDDNLAMISMPVINFAKKYNLSLDFNKEKILLNKTELQNKIQNYNNPIIESMEEIEHQSEKKNVNNYDNIKKDGLSDENNIDAIDKFSDLINSRKKKNIPNMNFPILPITQRIFNFGKNSKEFEVRKVNAEMNQSKVDQELKLTEVENTNNVQNTVQKINFKNQGNLIPKEINISEDSKISKEEQKWDKLLDIAEENFRGNIEKTYRYQRNANDVENKGTELIKSMLYWLKGLFVDS